MAKLYEKMPPPQTDFNGKFESWALKNQFPPAVQEHQMMQEWVKYNQIRKKTEAKNEYLQELRNDLNNLHTDSKKKLLTPRLSDGDFLEYFLQPPISKMSQTSN